MFILKNQQQLDAATEKARARKPRLSVIQFSVTASGCRGVYYVTGRKGDVYSVTCEKNQWERKLVHCDCAAGERGNVCYHAASAISLHIVLAADETHPLRVRLTRPRARNVLAFPKAA